MIPSTKTKNIIVISCIIASLLILFVILFPFQFSYVQYYQVFIVGYNSLKWCTFLPGKIYKQ